jgi:hypothetical protein
MKATLTITTLSLLLLAAPVAAEPASEAESCPLHAAHMAAAGAAANGTGADHAAGADDPAASRRELDARGDRYMGFSQQATVHHFRLAGDGGAIEVTAREAGDAASVAQVRSHLRAIAAAFAKGDFSIPAAVHARVPPGVQELRTAGAEVTYRYEEMPAGARVVLAAATAAALAAVHQFLRFQIADHGTGDPAHVH